MSQGTRLRSAWIVRCAALIEAGGRVLDVACGTGRHAVWFARRGHKVLAVDRDREALSQSRGVPGVQLLCADLEAGGLPTEGLFAGVVVTDYLWRPLLPVLVERIAPAGALLYETFMVGQETIGRPRRPEFLLQPGELATAVAPLSIVAFEQGLDPHTGTYRQRVAAVRRPPGTAPIPPIQ